MSRFLAAFRAGRAAGAKSDFSPPYGPEYPENPENLPQPTCLAPGEGGFRGFRSCRDHTPPKNAVSTGAPDRAAFLARAAEDAAEALAAPDPDLAHERAEIAAAQAAEVRGEYGQPKPEADHRAALAGILAAGRQRPPAWADPTSLPLPGAWCSCCGRFSRTGGRWWREAVNPAGWRCATCHPALPGMAVVVVET